MKGFLNFVRAMLNNPQVLFLDEPTAGINPKNARILKDTVSECRAKGGTAFLTAHLTNDADELCDRAVSISLSHPSLARSSPFGFVGNS